MKSFIRIPFFILIILVLLYQYIWWFMTLEVKQEATWPYDFIYAQATWSYKKVWTLMNRVWADLMKLWVEQTAWLWIYFDDPSVVATDQLRSEVWSIVTGDIDMQDIELYKYQIIDSADRLIVEFPYRNMLSYYLWPIKAYPVLSKYIETNQIEISGPMMEYYDVANKKIYYMATIR